MTATSGRGLPVPLGFYDPDTRSLRTSADTFDSDSTPSSVTLPSSGSMRSGALYARRRSALPTSAAASSSSPLLKTPTANLAVNGGSQHPDKRRSGGHGPTLANEVEHLLPTPAARDWKSGASNLIGTNSGPLNEVAVNLLPTPVVADARDTANFRPDGTPYGQGYGPTLLDATRHLLPTPRASDGAKGGPNQRGSKGDLALPAVAHRIGSEALLPTPTASDGDRTSLTYGRGNLTLTGAVSPPPSAAGNTPPDDEPHGQLTIEIG